MCLSECLSFSGCFCSSSCSHEIYGCTSVFFINLINVQSFVYSLSAHFIDVFVKLTVKIRNVLIFVSAPALF